MSAKPANSANQPEHISSIDPEREIERIQSFARLVRNTMCLGRSLSNMRLHKAKDQVRIAIPLTADCREDLDI
jgi:hypothetical protein